MVENIEVKILSRFACRYLSPPPASVTRKQLFSGAVLIYDQFRNRSRLRRLQYYHLLNKIHQFSNLIIIEQSFSLQNS